MNQTNPIHTDLMFNSPSSSCSSYVKERRIMKTYEHIVIEDAKAIAEHFSRPKSSIFKTFARIERLREDQLDEIIQKELSVVDLITHLNGITFDKDRKSIKTSWDK